MLRFLSGASAALSGLLPVTAPRPAVERLRLRWAQAQRVATAAAARNDNSHHDDQDDEDDDDDDDDGTSSSGGGGGGDGMQSSRASPRRKAATGAPSRAGRLLAVHLTTIARYIADEAAAAATAGTSALAADAPAGRRERDSGRTMVETMRGPCLEAALEERIP